MTKTPFRRPTKTIFIGKLPLGSEHPIRIQSMVNIPTSFTDKVCSQIMQLADIGCEIVRLAIPSVNDAKNLEIIKNILIKKNYTIPLVADIHFFPPAAMVACDFVEKIRINPGNFIEGGKKICEKTFFTLLEEKFLPLIEKCQKYKRCLRIGVNHGSLSLRIIERYGNTIEAMIISAMEYMQFCQEHNFHNVIFSMKSSNVKIMIDAYLQLAKALDAKGWNYPFHLGVTEAGFGIEGRCKSAVGVGSLLLQGIGDTIRISLTEDPQKEIPACQDLLLLQKNYEKKSKASISFLQLEHLPLKPLKIFLFSSAIEKTLQQEDLKDIDGLITQDLKMYLLQKEKIDKEIPIFDIQRSTVDTMKPYAIYLSKNTESHLQKLKTLQPSYIIYPIKKASEDTLKRLQKEFPHIPIILQATYSYSKNKMATIAGAEVGLYLIQQLADGLFLKGKDFSKYRAISLCLAQASKRKISGIEFISCPGCGRTRFNLQKVAQNIKKKLSHKRGIKVAVMGCCVNGPGEMADADFGYVGSKDKTIDLYIGKTCIEKYVPENIAIDKLVQLIESQDLLR